MKRVVLSVTNDLVNDRRVERSIKSLQEQGYTIHFVGRQLAESRPVKASYSHKRFKLSFNKGFLFYATFNLRLFFHLLFQKAFDLYWANDLDTLLPNYLVAKIYRKPLVYDSHEYFKGVPEIQNRPIVKWVWTQLENFLFKRADYHLTVNESIANLLESDYGLRPAVVRNIAESYLPEIKKGRADLSLPEDAFLLINQGAGINIDRGMEEAFEALKLLPENIHLVLVGKGDVIPFLKLKAREEGLIERVHFVNPLPYQEMIQYTLQANVGLSLDKDTNINYRFSLPNKLFDYIKCGIPVLSSQVKEVDKIVRGEGIGISVAVEPKAIAEAVLSIQAEPEKYKQALEIAAQKHNWEHESKRLAAFIAAIKL